jgi:hypothetical protein
MAIIGYARVSSLGRSLEVQLDKLKFCDHIYQEKKSAAFGKPGELKSCLDYAIEGDTCGDVRAEAAYYLQRSYENISGLGCLDMYYLLLSARETYPSVELKTLIEELDWVEGERFCVA